MHTGYCDVLMNSLQEKIRKYMTDKPEYRRENLRYLNYEMKMLDQSDLISWLKEMNLKELQYAQGAGIPGHANTIALQLIAQRKKDMEEYLRTKGSEPIPEVEAEKPILSEVKVSTEDKEAWVEPEDLPTEEAEDGGDKVHASKEGRERDS